MLLADDARALAALARVEVLYTDLDGTLLTRGSVVHNAEDEPSTVAVSAIVELARAGLTVVPVSGRTVPQLTELTRLLGWQDFIAEAGGVIVRGQVRERTLDYLTGDWDARHTPTGVTPYQAIAEAGAIEALACAFPGRIEYHTPWHENRESSHLLRGCLDLDAAQRLLDELTLPIDIVDNGIVRPQRHTLACDGGPMHAYHLVPRGVTKTAAIARDIADRGFKPAQAAAIGDSAADLQMAEAVGLLALVSNALDSPAVCAAAPCVDNARLLAKPRGEGWAEFAALWLQARSGSR
jgi:hydroxymethylpyrimidine pyrophosphatase-like HAD family hydrolase